MRAMRSPVLAAAQLADDLQRAGFHATQGRNAYAATVTVRSVHTKGQRRAIRAIAQTWAQSFVERVPCRGYVTITVEAA